MHLMAVLPRCTVSRHTVRPVRLAAASMWTETCSSRCQRHCLVNGALATRHRQGSLGFRVLGSKQQCGGNASAPPSCRVWSSPAAPWCRPGRRTRRTCRQPAQTKANRLLQWCAKRTSQHTACDTPLYSPTGVRWSKSMNKQLLDRSVNRSIDQLSIERRSHE